MTVTKAVKRMTDVFNGQTKGDAHESIGDVVGEVLRGIVTYAVAAENNFQFPDYEYPTAVFFIVCSQFCERFCYYGIRTVLALYLRNSLRFAQRSAQIIYHTFTMFVYIFPLLSGILSDSWLGKYRMILYLAILYASGGISLSLSAIFSNPFFKRICSLFALFLIASGTGGMKPCVSAFGGDQFVLPQKQAELATYFSLLYFSINAGRMMSTLSTPMLRYNIECFGDRNCFPMAFAVPSAVMILAIVMFILGKPLYRIKQPKGNIVVAVIRCITYAITHRKVENSGDHWLDRSKEQHGYKLVKDTKIVLKVLVMYIPFPIFWALYEQQGSRWTFQAARMNGYIGFYTILPDQMQVFNPLLILVFIPLFTYLVYPLLTKFNLLKTPLQRIGCGGFLAAISFVVSAWVSVALENTYPVLPSRGKAQVRIYDTTNCQYSFSTANDVIPTAPINGYYLNSSVVIPKSVQTVNFTFTPNENNCKPRELHTNMHEKTAYGIYINDLYEDYYVDYIQKSEDGYPLVRTLVNNNSISVNYVHHNKEKSATVAAGYTGLVPVGHVGTYLIDVINRNIEFKLGGTYTVMINQELNTLRAIEVTKPNSVHMLWLVPQYVLMTAAEVMFSITGLEFSYSQAPISMKSVLQACYLLTTAIGNLLIVLVESASIFLLQSHSAFLYSGFMVIDMMVFMWLAIRYTYEIEDDISVLGQEN